MAFVWQDVPATHVQILMLCSPVVGPMFYVRPDGPLHCARLSRVNF